MDEEMEEIFHAVHDAEATKRFRVLNGESVFVCYLDVDGFKERLLNDAATLYAEYAELSKYMVSFFRVNAESQGSEIKLHHLDRLVWPYLFSDSWFFATIDDSEESFRQISYVASGLWMRSIELKLVARGSIAHGRTWWQPEKQIILGQPLAEAYQLAESLECYGVAISPTIDCSKWLGSSTNPIPVPRSSRAPDGRRITCAPEPLRFVLFSPREGLGRWNADRYLERFVALKAAYERRPDASPRVVARYEASGDVAEAMLAPMRDRWLQEQPPTR